MAGYRYKEPTFWAKINDRQISLSSLTQIITSSVTYMHTAFLGATDHLIFLYTAGFSICACHPQSQIIDRLGFSKYTAFVIHLNIYTIYLDTS